MGSSAKKTTVESPTDKQTGKYGQEKKEKSERKMAEGRRDEQKNYSGAAIRAKPWGEYWGQNDLN